MVRTHENIVRYYDGRELAYNWLLARYTIDHLQAKQVRTVRDDEDLKWFQDHLTEICEEYRRRAVERN